MQNIMRMMHNNANLLAAYSKEINKQKILSYLILSHFMSSYHFKSQLILSYSKESTKKKICQLWLWAWSEEKLPSDKFKTLLQSLPIEEVSHCKYMFG